MFSFLTSYTMVLFIPDLIVSCLTLLTFLFLLFELIFSEEDQLRQETIKAYDVTFLISCFIIGYIQSRINLIGF